MLAKKAPITVHPLARIPKEQLFYPETTELFLQAWTQHLQNEIKAEQLRVLTQKKANFSAIQAFKIIDSNSDGFIDKDDVSGDALAADKCRHALSLGKNPPPRAHESLTIEFCVAASEVLLTALSVRARQRHLVARRALR